MDMVW